MRGLKSFALLLVIAVALVTYVVLVEWKKTPGDEEAKKDKVFAVESGSIDEIVVKSEAGERTTLKKSGSEWQIAQPLSAAADAAEASGLTSNLSSVEIQRVVDENPADLKEFGLAEPRVEVTFKAGGQSHTLHIGRKTPTGSDLYARVADQKKVFLIPGFLDSTFNRTTFDLRDKTVVKVDATKVDALEVALSNRTLKFVKKDGEWEIEQPIAARADFGSVEGLVGRITSAQMKAIVPDAEDLKRYGLDKPVATVRVGSGSSQAALAIGANTTEGTVYARDLSRPAIFTLESTIADELKKDAGDFRQKDLFDARPFNATRLEVTRNGQTVAFEKAQDKWKQVAPAPKDVDSEKVETLLSAATNARALGFVTASTKTNQDKPDLTIAIKFDQGKEDRVSFSRAGADGFASRAGTPGAATVETATIDAIIKAFDEIK